MSIDAKPGDIDLFRSAEPQHGAFSRAQAVAAGLSPGQIRRRVASGVFVVCLPNVYRLRGVPETWQQKVMAGTLWSGGWASHRSAGGLRGWDGVPKGFVEVTTTKNLRPVRGVIVHRTKYLPEQDREEWRGIPVTGSARTLLDLGAVLSCDEVELAFEDALRRHDLTMPRARWQLTQEGESGRGGTGCFRQIVEARPPGYRVKRSPLEIKVLRSIRRAGLPEPVYEHPVMTPDGMKRPDFSYPSSLAAIECESYTYHGGRLVWLGDIERYKLLRRLGWTVIQVTEETLDGGDKEALFHADVRAALGLISLGAAELGRTTEEPADGLLDV